MKVIAINGGPRKQWNTAALLHQALDGAASQGAETELIHLYDLRFSGCTSCFACKRLGGASYGRCAVQDDLAPVLRRIEQADALVLGSPMYFGSVTGMFRCFLERLAFQYLVYDKERTVLTPRQIPTGFVSAMNVPDAEYYKEHLGSLLGLLQRIIGPAQGVYAADTYQFDDYAKFASSAFDAQHKAEHRQTVFPEDCRRAYDMGVDLVRQAREMHP